MIITIKFLPESDIEKCVDLTKQIWQDSPRVQRHINQELKNPNIVYIAAYDDDKLVGYAGYMSSSINYDIFEFVWCNVDPLYQRQGIGRKLTEKRIELIKLAGGKVILLTTPSPEIYRRYGFVSLTQYQLWDKKPFYLMSLELNDA